MIINIYKLINPSTNEVIYVGQTRYNLEKRLDSHYWKLNEAKRGKRTMTKLFKFLDSYLPLKVKIELITTVDTDLPFRSADFLEKYYIDYYRKINPNLLNEANGGLGGYTAINKSDDEKKEIGYKISFKTTGCKKPKEFAEHLSSIRKGKNNPMAKPFTYKVGAYLNGELVKTFSYAYEIDEFVEKRGSWSNVKKVLTGKIKFRPYGFDWKYIKE